MQTTANSVQRFLCGMCLLCAVAMSCGEDEASGAGDGSAGQAGSAGHAGSAGAIGEGGGPPMGGAPQTGGAPEMAGAPQSGGIGGDAHGGAGAGGDAQGGAGAGGAAQGGAGAGGAGDSGDVTADEVCEVACPSMHISQILYEACGIDAGGPPAYDQEVCRIECLEMMQGEIPPHCWDEYFLAERCWADLYNWECEYGGWWSPICDPIYSIYLDCAE